MFENYDTLLVFNDDNRYYFSGFNSSFGCIILTEKKKVFITDKRYEIEARQRAEDFTVICVNGSDLYDIIDGQLKLFKSKVVGFEEETTTVSEFNTLKSKLSDYEFVGASKSIAEKRLIKSESEIEKIAKAEEITQLALTNVIPDIKVGMSEKELSDLITYSILRQGAQGLAFDTIVCFGETAACPHHKPSADVKLNENDLILVDMGALVDGYCGDMTRTFCLGTPDPKLEQIHKTVLDAQLFALRNLRAGMTCKEADGLAREYLLAHGYKDEFSHSLGHGIGIAIHEPPCVSSRNDEILRENMVVSCEPGIYIEGLGGVRIEDIVVIKNDGVVNLTTNFSKEIKL